MKRLIPVFAAWLATSQPVLAEEALIAVATNFNNVARQLVSEFETQSGHNIVVASGSTGILTAQVTHGAPYDVLLAADQERPMLLEHSGFAVVGSRFTFASGRLALWSANAKFIQAELSATLGQRTMDSLAIANPALAPYGIASRETLQSLDLWENLRGKIVMGENVGQVHALVATGNARAGLVALSQVLLGDLLAGTDYLVVPEALHAPIRQDAVLLRHGEGNSAAIGFLLFLRSERGRSVIRASGYRVD